MQFDIGDIVLLKKTHPCGGKEWEVLRTGIDFRIKCTTCGRLVMVSRPKFEKSVKKTVQKGSPAANQETERQNDILE